MASHCWRCCIGGSRNGRLWIRSLELGASLICHECKRACDFDIVQIGIAALGQHGVETLDRMRNQRIEACGNALAPRAGVAGLGSPCRAGAVAGHAGIIATCSPVIKTFGALASQKVKPSSTTGLIRASIDAAIWPVEPTSSFASEVTNSNGRTIQTMGRESQALQRRSIASVLTP